ncbi:MAG: hypothetical protein ABJG41_09240 [Cyclobacteriaceae bacterium]
MSSEPNLSYIKSLSKGDMVFEKQLLGVAKRELTEEIDLYTHCIENHKYEQAAEVVHKIKHKVSLLGMETSYSLVAQFEEELRVGKTRLKLDFMAILKKMTNFLN